MAEKIKYLRLILTEHCNLSCQYCHKEGIQHKQQSTIDLEQSIVLIKILYKYGIRKFKLMGGEPTLYKYTAEIIRSIKSLGNDTEVSMITNGLFDNNIMNDYIEAGLDRVNVSVHSWGSSFTMNLVGMNNLQLNKLKLNMDYLISKNMLSKINYVFMKSQGKKELIELIKWVDNNRLVIDILNVLTNLGVSYDEYCSFEEIEKFVRENFVVNREYYKNNLFSLPSKRLVLENGGEVNLKITKLNECHPFKSCDTCDFFNCCIEGIKAIRLTTNNIIQPCLVRSDNVLKITDFEDEDAIEDKVFRYLDML